MIDRLVTKPSKTTASLIFRSFIVFLRLEISVFALGSWNMRRKRTRSRDRVSAHPHRVSGDSRGCGWNIARPPAGQGGCKREQPRLKDIVQSGLSKSFLKMREQTDCDSNYPPWGQPVRVIIGAVTLGLREPEYDTVSG
jgi:hypothetical protein